MECAYVDSNNNSDRAFCDRQSMQAELQIITANRRAYSAVEERILRSAEMLFADQGFRGTSLREITDRAGCNIAAVNYHFHGKENLYVAVFQHHMKTITSQRLWGLKEILSQDGIELTLEGFLRVFADSIVRPFFSSEQGQLGFKLLLQERQDPHLPKQMFFHEVVEPQRSIIREPLRTLCPYLSEEQANQRMYSLFAQLIYMLHAQSLFVSVDKAKIPVLNLDRILKHIIRFTVAGIRQYQTCGGQRT